MQQSRPYAMLDIQFNYKILYCKTLHVLSCNSPSTIVLLKKIEYNLTTWIADRFMMDLSSQIAVYNPVRWKLFHINFDIKITIFYYFLQDNYWAVELLVTLRTRSIRCMTPLLKKMFERTTLAVPFNWIREPLTDTGKVPLLL